MLLIAGLFVLLSSPSASAQFQNVGKFDTWTTNFSRSHQTSKVTHLRQVRASKQKDFDRVVFELDGEIPSYTIKYLASHFYEDLDGKHRIRIAGTACIELELMMIPYDEEQNKLARHRGFVPKGDLKMPSLRQIDNKGTFESVYDFLLGVTSRKVFRVSELSNPSRLVIDLRH
jgi:hypothetical protein